MKMFLSISFSITFWVLKRMGLIETVLLSTICFIEKYENKFLVTHLSEYLFVLFV